VAILISVSGVRKAFAARPLFDGLTFSIESGERIGLIGPNGAGKSTLFKLLASQASPDEGTISFQRGLRVGFLEQTPSFKKDATIHSTLLEGALDPDDWESIALADEISSKLSLQDPSQRVDQLSGGWKKRVALGRELVRSPDLLLLDEPTNHLDLDSIYWLEEWISNARLATLTITHDRAFLQKVSNRILELDRRNPGGLLSVKGDYLQYLEVKEQCLATQERHEVVLKNTLRRETEWLRQGAKARTTKQQARIQRAETLKNEVSELQYRNQARTVKLDFQTTERNPKKLIEAREISKSWGKGPLFSGLNLVLSPGKRLGILGANGCGKSTLIQTLLKEEEPDSGAVFHADNLTVAYFQQNREALDPKTTVAKTLCPSGDFVDYRGDRIHIRGYLDRFLFSQGQMDMAVGKLSGGEQGRLLIAQLMLQPANLLVLDEPTNDLDMATLAVLEDCLTEFQGAVLLVTHDRYFLDQVANQIISFSPFPEERGQLTSFASLGQWETWFTESTRNGRSQGGTATTISQASAGSLTNPTQNSKKRKLTFKEQRELDSMEETIRLIEKELAHWTEESTKSENTSNSSKLVEITDKMNHLQAEIERLYARWAELE
jgi:ATP-binding cassette subfamily F protein uup